MFSWTIGGLEVGEQNLTWHIVMSKPCSSTLQMAVRPNAFYNDHGSRANVSQMIVSFRKERQMLIYTAHHTWARGGGKGGGYR